MIDNLMWQVPQFWVAGFGILILVSSCLYLWLTRERQIKKEIFQEELEDWHQLNKDW